MTQPKTIAYLEPFYGGSHKAFVDGLVRHSRHTIELFTLPDRFWKWRTRGAALDFFRQVRDPGAFDLVMASDMVNLAELQGLWGQPVTTVQYMHENQLTYPLKEGEQRDANHVMTDLLSAFSATGVVFNSHSHMDAFFAAAKEFSRHIPDCKPAWILPQIKAKSRVLYPGITFGEMSGSSHAGRSAEGMGPVLLWNHRWEYDKVPADFYRALHSLESRKVPFQLVLLGERAESNDPWLERIGQEFSEKILFCGYAETQEAYHQWLSRCDMVVSTAIQENYGISCIEAMHHGCTPLFPRRLSYPEIVPPELHDRCLYTDVSDLADRIAAWLPEEPKREEFHRWTGRFAWPQLIGEYDAYLGSI